MEHKGKCYICGADLVFDENDPNCTITDLDGEGINKEILCPHCGTTYVAYLRNDEEEEESHKCEGILDQGFGRCFECGGTLIWGGDFMRSDLDEDLPEEDDAIFRNLGCSECGISYNVYEPTENEKKNYPFWKEDKL